MSVQIRDVKESDGRVIGQICFDAFTTIARAHNFPPDFPSAEVAIGLVSMMIDNPGFYGVVAERDGRIAGSNFLDERSPISGVGPLTVDPEQQNGGIGGRLMQAVMQRSDQRGFAGIRLVQSGYHCRSLSLYSKLGFEIREHLSCMQGPAIKQVIPGYAVRPATESDLEACNALCFRVHGHARSGELQDAVAQRAAMVVERASRIAGYAAPIAFFGHAVAETNDDLKALIAQAQAFAGPGFLVPSRNGELMRWCLSHGLKVVQPMTLMTRGLYNEPVGAWLPSILY
jgi:GNAT superfamily N-acetyltransferase